MLVALNENHELKSLLEEIPDRRQKFFCPACKSEVRLKSGPVKIPHFAHVSLQNCQSWSENESEQHLSLKKTLFAWASQSEKTEIEIYLPALEQTPDLLISDRIAIEVQCSRLSVKRLRERTLNYREHGFSVLWLAGKDLWLDKSLTALQQDLLYFSENSGFHYWELDLERSCLRLKYMIHQNLRGQLSFLAEEFSFGGGDLLEIFRKPFAAQALPILQVESDDKIRGFVQKSLFRRDPHWMAIQEKYYLAGKNLLLEEKFVQQWGPPGLNLLTGDRTKLTFCQISQDLTEYYRDFQKHSVKDSLGTPAGKELENLYPPRYYAIIKNTITGKESQENKQRRRVNDA